MLPIAFWSIRRSPPFSTAVVIITGATVAMATIGLALLRQVVFTPLPYPLPDNIVAIWDTLPREGAEKFRVSSRNYLAWAERQTVFESMALIGWSQATLFDHGEPVALRGATVTEDYFELLGARPVLGRTLEASDYESGAPAVVVLSHDLWTGAFRSDPGIVGRSVFLDQIRTTVIGVMPDIVMPLGAWASGRFEMSADTPYYWAPRRDLRATPSHVHGAIARIRTGVSLSQARAQMEQIARTLEQEWPDWNEGGGVLVVPSRTRPRPRLSGVLYGWSPAPPAFSSCSRARTSPTCFFCGRSTGSARSWFAPHSARAARRCGGCCSASFCSSASSVHHAGGDYVSFFDVHALSTMSQLPPSRRSVKSAVTGVEGLSTRTYARQS